LLDFGIAPQAPALTSGIEPDEFYGKESLEAAKMFLRKRGKPASLAEIIAGIKMGGGNPGSENALKMSLTRSTYQIAKINDDLFGLVEFYPGGLKRGRSAKKKNGGDSGDTDAAQEEEAQAQTEPQDAQEGITWDEESKP
jgi:hypothetical protein